MEKRPLIAVALSALILVVYYGFFYQPPVPPPATQVISTAPNQPNTADQPSTQKPPVEPNEVEEPVVAIPETTTPVETEWVSSILSSRAGLPIQWLLKNYFMKPDQAGGNVDLLKDGDSKTPLKLFLLADQPPLSLNLNLQEVQNGVVQYQGDFSSLGIQEQLDFTEKDYSLKVKISLENKGAEAKTIRPGIRVELEQTPETSKGFFVFKQPTHFKTPLYRLGTKTRHRTNVKKLGVYQEEEGEISWAGIEDQYFLRLIVARNLSPYNRVAYGSKEGKVFSDLYYASDVLSPGQTKEYEFLLYLGPKDPGLLAKFGNAQLGQAINYGWFGFLAVPILRLLKFFHSFLLNWGLAIIALTILIKLLLNPLTRKSMKSMKAMQDLQPQLQKIRVKYKEDREKLNLETMSLFKTHKVNPMGGCLPMVLQMPIYIALYKVLYNATELYHAPFFGFYHDLSAPDPYFVLPILLGIFMVLQQKLTPTAGDPAQAKMMMIMPVMFSLFMLFLPLGLVLYIFVNTLFTVTQQYMHQKDISILGLLKGAKRG
jgi:YidC/Oxa1 family membrane protein insertase